MKVTQIRVYEGSKLIEICESLEEAKQVAREFIQESLNFEVQVYEVKSESNGFEDLIDVEKTLVFEIEKYEDNTIEEFVKA
jgi:hypothetical protein